MNKPEKKLSIITNRLMGMPLNSYAVEHTDKGVHLLGIRGCEEGKKFFNSHKEYARFLKYGNYRKHTEIPYHFVESYMEYYQCACVEAINCLLAPVEKEFKFENGRIKEAFECVLP